jgi:HSP20 family protein
MITSDTEPVYMFGRLDRLFDDWMKMLPLAPSMGRATTSLPEGSIRVDEYHENGTLVVRAELPGVDPVKDVEITVTDGVLHIVAERRSPAKEDDKTLVRRELRYGAFSRALRLPEGTTATDITATYADGILEIRVPRREPTPPSPITIPVNAS